MCIAWLLLGSMMLVAVCQAVPEGYLLDVSKDCGDAFNGKVYDASVIIMSDLHVKAVLSCAGGVQVVMNPINDTNTRITEPLYYIGDKNGTFGKDCFFNRPHKESNLYVVDLMVFWGFTDGSLMKDYEAYTISCTTQGDATETLAGKSISDDAVAVKDNLEGNLKSKFTGTQTLTLVDVLGDEIKDNNVPMGKKVKLQMTISGGSAKGLTPYDCVATNSDSSKSYKILNAGCGDGVIFPKNVGFDTSAKISTSPHFKIFKLLEAIGTSASISYTCEFVTCTKLCDGSSCALRTKRSAIYSKDQQQRSVSSAVYKLDKFKRRLAQSERKVKDLKMKTRITTTTVTLFGVGGLAVLSLMVALYSCLTRGNRSLQPVPST